MRFWVKLGFISFGGPAGQIAIMHRELVERGRWIGEQRFLHALNFCMLLPGPEAQQLATYIGWLMHRTWGGIAAGALFVIPSVFILLGLSYVYARFGKVLWISGALYGLKAVVVAVVLEAVVKIGRRAFKSWLHVVIAAGAFAGIYVFGIPFPLIILAALALGCVGALTLPNIFNTKPPAKPAASADAVPEVPFVISDDGPLPAHAQPKAKRLFWLLLLWAVLWVLPLGSVLAAYGSESLPAKIYLFFSQAAFVTFGGAYAVLAYVKQFAVDSAHWITSEQAMAGFALAETTPGPLIMVLQFIGFMAGWNNPDGFTPTWSAVLCALLTTFATFLPCFFFILIGGPYLERIRKSRILSGALSAVTAAVVGVILNLALSFGATALFPEGHANVLGLCISAVSFVLLVFLKLDVLWVIGGGALVGLARVLFLP